MGCAMLLRVNWPTASVIVMETSTVPRLPALMKTCENLGPDCFLRIPSDTNGWIFVNGLRPAPRSGTWFNPFRELTDGAQALVVRGTVWIYAGSYSAGGDYSKRMTLRAASETVILGKLIHYSKENDMEAQL